VLTAAASESPVLLQLLLVAVLEMLVAASAAARARALPPLPSRAGSLRRRLCQCLLRC
jgi:hypothetical protein